MYSVHHTHSKFKKNIYQLLSRQFVSTNVENQKKSLPYVLIYLPFKNSENYFVVIKISHSKTLKDYKFQK